VRMMLGIRKRNWVLVLPVAGLGIGYLLLLGRMLWGNVSSLAAAKSAPPTPARAAIALWDAYGQARAAAQAQATDAQLVSASAQWQAASEEALLKGASAWTFVFYSPAGGYSLDVVANAGTARAVNQAQVWVAPQTMLAESAWQAGPRDALLVFLACGGRTFLDGHPQAVVDLHLAGDAQGKPVWAIVALDPQDRSLLPLLIDAETRQVLPE